MGSEMLVDQLLGCTLPSGQAVVFDPLNESVVNPRLPAISTVN